MDSSGRPPSIDRLVRKGRHRWYRAGVSQAKLPAPVAISPADEGGQPLSLTICSCNYYYLSEHPIQGVGWGREQAAGFRCRADPGRCAGGTLRSPVKEQNYARR